MRQLFSAFAAAWMVFVFGSVHAAEGNGLNGAVRRDFSAKAGEVLQSSACIYQPLLAGRARREAKMEGNALRLGDWIHNFIE